MKNNKVNKGAILDITSTAIILAGCLLVLLKLFKVITCSWLVVLSPFLIILILVIAALVYIYSSGKYKSSRNEARQR